MEPPSLATSSLRLSDYFIRVSVERSCRITSFPRFRYFTYISCCTPLQVYDCRWADL